MWIIICVLVWITALMRYVGCRSSFETRPTAEQLNQYSIELITHKATLTDGLTAVRNKMPWMDSITYEDARQLNAKNELTENNARLLFQ